MSESNIYQPHVTLAGEKLGETVTHNGPRVVANIVIKWGSDDWYSDIDAAILTLTILDHRPQLGIDLAADNARVQIRREPDNKTVFRGRVRTATTRPVTFNSPRSGTPTQTYEHVLTCDDPLGEMRRDRRRGKLYPGREGEDQVAHWGPCTMSERKGDIQERTLIGINFDVSPIDSYDSMSGGGFAFMWPVTPYERQNTVSALTVLRNTVRIGRPLARPVYDPATNTITPLSPPFSHSTLYWALGSSEHYISKGEAILVDAKNLVMVEDLEVSSTEVELVTDIELQIKGCRPNQVVTSSNSASGTRQILEWVDAPVRHVISPGAEAQMTVSLETDHSAGFYYSETSDFLNIATKIGNMYGVPLMPPFEYRFDKTAPADPVFLEWLTPTIPRDGFWTRSYQLINSAANAWSRIGPISLVGGELTYTHKQGWRARLNPTPTGWIEASRTLAAIVADVPDNPRIDAAHDNFTVADLQHVSGTKTAI